MDADGQNKTFINSTGLQPTWKKRDVTPEPTPTPTPYPEPTPTPTPFPEVDVAVELTASPNPVAVGQNLTYTLIVRNNGPFAAENVEAFLIRSASTELVSVSAAQGTCGPDGNPLTCQLGQLAGGAQTSIQFVVRPTAAGEIVAFAGANTPTPDSNLNNNQQRLALNVSDSCTPEVTSQVQRFIWSPGNQSQRNVTHVIYVRNNSGRQLNGQVHFVFDGLPASVESGDRRRPFSRTRCAQPLDRKYTSVSVGGRNQVWLPGQIIRLEVDFSNPNRVPVNYRLRIYTGPGLP